VLLSIALFVAPLVTPATETYTLSLHDALPISAGAEPAGGAGDVGSRRLLGAALSSPAQGAGAALSEACLAGGWRDGAAAEGWTRSEEHTSELQSRENLVCRLLLE